MALKHLVINKRKIYLKGHIEMATEEKYQQRHANLKVYASLNQLICPVEFTILGRNLFRPFNDIKNMMKWDSEVSTSSSPVRSRRQLPTSVHTGQEFFEQKCRELTKRQKTFITEVSLRANSSLQGRIKNSPTEHFFPHHNI